MMANTPQRIKKEMKGMLIEIVCNQVRRAFELLRERKDLNPKVHLSLREKPSDYISL